MTKEVLVELDERRRASLARIAHPGHSRYLTRIEPDGTIIMRPVDLVPAMPAKPAPAPPMVGDRLATVAPATPRERFEAKAPDLWEPIRQHTDLDSDQRERAPVEPLAEPHPVDGTRPQPGVISLYRDM